MKNYLIFVLLSAAFMLFGDDINMSYVQVSGEGPVGQYLIGFDKITYSKEDGVNLAKKEIFEFLSGMVYGYTFVYKVENAMYHSDGFFELKSIAKIKETDTSLTLYQALEKENGLKINAIYRLSEDQKTYIRGFQSSLANMTMGDALDSWTDKWDKRFTVFKMAVRNAVLNEAKSKYKSRPLFIKGKILLFKSPEFSVISGQWKVQVKAHIIIQEVSYMDTY